MRNTPAHISLSIEQAERFVADVFGAVGVAPANAALAAEALVAADIEGSPSHGVMLLPLYVDRILAGSVSPTATGSVVSDNASAIVVDADNALGQITAEMAVSLAAARAPQSGLAAVAVRNAFHFGAAGFWARRIARSDQIGIVLSNTRPLMPAPGGTERIVGNNPLAIAVPSADTGPVVFDMAMSASAMGKIRVAAAQGQKIPAGWATDQHGTPTTNAADAIMGMLLPVGGGKGFGLAFMIDLLVGGLSSGALGDDVAPLYGDPSRQYRCSSLFLAIDIASFRLPAEFKAAVQRQADRVRASATLEAAEPAHVPGDRARRARTEATGTCKIDAATAVSLAALAHRLDVPAPPELQLTAMENALA